MTNRRTLAPAALLTLLAAAGPLAAQAAEPHNMLFGAGAGYGTVAKKGGDNGSGPQLHGRIGWQFTDHAAAVLELGLFGLNSEKPRVGDIGVDANNNVVRLRQPRLFRTTTLLLGVQLAGEGHGYFRAGAGAGIHEYGVYGDYPTFTYAQTGIEAGLAAGVAAGYQMRLGPVVHLAVEAIAQYSRGEDSSADRTVLGVQVVPLLQR